MLVVLVEKRNSYVVILCPSPYMCTQPFTLHIRVSNIISRPLVGSYRVSAPWLMGQRAMINNQGIIRNYMNIWCRFHRCETTKLS